MYLILDQFLLHPFLFHVINMLKSLGHLTCRVFHSLDFADCSHLMQFNLSCHPLHLLQIGICCSGWIRFSFGSLGKSMGGGVVFHQEEHNVWLSLFL